MSEEKTSGGSHCGLQEHRFSVIALAAVTTLLKLILYMNLNLVIVVVGGGGGDGRRGYRRWLLMLRTWI